MMENYLEIDIGNSFCKWQVRSSLGVVTTGLSQTSKCIDLQMFSAIKAITITKVSVCSVVSEALNQQLVLLVSSLWGIEARFFKVKAQCSGVVNSYAKPEKMGADRWLASIAAKNLYPDRAICIADCGSAVNVEFLSAAGVHQGGYILPGLRLMQQALFQNTSKIDKSALKGSLELGVDTESNVANGSLFMAVSALEKLQEKIRETNGLLVLTGGDALLIKQHLKEGSAVYVPNLVLQGFLFI